MEQHAINLCHGSERGVFELTYQTAQLVLLCLDMPTVEQE